MKWVDESLDKRNKKIINFLLNKSLSLVLVKHGMLSKNHVFMNWVLIKDDIHAASRIHLSCKVGHVRFIKKNNMKT